MTSPSVTPTKRLIFVNKQCPNGKRIIHVDHVFPKSNKLDLVGLHKSLAEEQSQPSCTIDTLCITDAAGFLDVPAIIAAGRLGENFPHLLPEVENIRSRDFPLLTQERIYFDNGATTQEPRSVRRAYERWRDGHIRGSNHSWNSTEARKAEEDVVRCKETIARFFGAQGYHIALTSGVTEASNLFAVRFDFKPGDLMLITAMEHNSEVITARNFAQLAGAEVAYVPVTSQGNLDLDALRTIVEGSKHKRIIMNLVHVSNVTGAINDPKEIRAILGDRSIIYLDMAQSAAHIPINLDILGVDFAGVSSHKIYGPFGVGALFIREGQEDLLNNMLMGGGAVDFVTPDYEKTLAAPKRFELGTRNLEGAHEWALALEWLESIGLERAAAHECELGTFFASELAKIPGVEILGDVAAINGTHGVVSLNIGGHQRMMHGVVARKLNDLGVIVRNGCFCAHIYTSRLTGTTQYSQERVAEIRRHYEPGPGDHVVPGAARFVFAVYNTILEVYVAIQAIRKIADEMINRPVDVNMAWISYVNDQEKLFRDPIDPRDVYGSGDGQYSHPALHPVVLSRGSLACGEKIYTDYGSDSPAFKAFEMGFTNAVNVSGNTFEDAYAAGICASQRWKPKS